MTTTPKIQQLVREGRVKPYDAALLMELRGRVAAERNRVKFREHPFLAVAVFIGVFFLGLFGIRRDGA